VKAAKRVIAKCDGIQTTGMRPSSSRNRPADVEKRARTGWPLQDANGSRHAPHVRTGEPRCTSIVQESPTAAKMKEIRDIAMAARDEAAETMKAEYDARHVERKFKVGDRVWWREHEPANKLAPKRSGPYAVKTVISDINYELEELPQGSRSGGGTRSHMCDTWRSSKWTEKTKRSSSWRRY